MDGINDFSHGDHADARRREKATGLARYLWDRAITTDEMRALTDAARRKLARAAGVNPPSGMETWEIAAELMARKDTWSRAHPEHPAAVPAHPDEKILWIKPPVKTLELAQHDPGRGNCAPDTSWGRLPGSPGRAVGDGPPDLRCTVPQRSKTAPDFESVAGFASHLPHA